jgi:hypothetical protein
MSLDEAVGLATDVLDALFLGKWETLVRALAADGVDLTADERADAYADCLATFTVFRMETVAMLRRRLAEVDRVH